MPCHTYKLRACVTKLRLSKTPNNSTFFIESLFYSVLLCYCYCVAAAADSASAVIAGVLLFRLTLSLSLSLSFSFPRKLFWRGTFSNVLYHIFVFSSLRSFSNFRHHYTYWMRSFSPSSFNSFKHPFSIVLIYFMYCCEMALFFTLAILNTNRQMMHCAHSFTHTLKICRGREAHTHTRARAYTKSN